MGKHTIVMPPSASPPEPHTSSALQFTSLVQLVQSPVDLTGAHPFEVHSSDSAHLE